MSSGACASTAMVSASRKSAAPRMRRAAYVPRSSSRLPASTETPVELTYNWDPEVYTGGRNFGHLAYEVDDIYAFCEKMQGLGYTINRPPRDGNMAFVRSPDNVSVEILQKGSPLPPGRAMGLDAQHGQLVVGWPEDLLSRARSWQEVTMLQTEGLKVERLDAIRGYLYAHGFFHHSGPGRRSRRLGSSTIRRDLHVLERRGRHRPRAWRRPHCPRLIGRSGLPGAGKAQPFGQARDCAMRPTSCCCPTRRSSSMLAPRVLQLARLIRINPLPLRIFTNGLMVAQEFLNVPNLERHGSGRPVRARTSRSSARRPRQCSKRSGSISCSSA